MKNRYYLSCIYLSVLLIFVLSSCQKQRFQSEYFDFAIEIDNVQFKAAIEQLSDYVVVLNVNNQNANSNHTDSEISENFVTNQTDALFVQDCGFFKVNHDPEDGVSPESKTIIYGSVVIGDQCWLDRNLGATKEAELL